MMTEFFESRFRILQLRGGQDGRLLDVFTQELCSQGLPRSRRGDISEPRNTCSIGRSERAYRPRLSMTIH